MGAETYLAPKIYRAEKVDRLLESLADALASATNIRHLQESDRVWVVISGPAAVHPRSAAPNVPRVTSRRVQIPQSQGRPKVDFPNPSTVWLQHPYQGAATSRGKSQSTLTLAAKKKDIDRLAEGSITANEFLANLKSQARE